MLALSPKLFRAIIGSASILLGAAAFAQVDLNSQLSNTPNLKTNQGINSIMPAETAFKLQTYISSNDEITLNWQIEPGYYLYRQSIKITNSQGSEVLELSLPDAQSHTDEFFGAVDVYYNSLQFRVSTSLLTSKVQGDDESLISFTLSYQGCAEDKYCYPPQQRNISIALN